MPKQNLPIGIENFEEFYTENYYYIDKTMFIKELLDQKAKVNLFTRPRRFGKTLTISMLKYFFEDSYDWDGNKVDYQHLFEGKAIMDSGESYLQHMGKYPVISLSMKDGKQSSFEDCMLSIKNAITDEYDRHSYILNGGQLSKFDKEKFERYLRGDESNGFYKDSLKFLSKCLRKWHRKPVIILIDEYDVPLEGSFVYNFYDRMVDFIRGLLEAALKTNDSLYFSVVTGCLRISKESIFTGLNNLKINSILNANYGEYFGFTDSEVEKLCNDYGMPQKYEEIKKWYNGYVFGGNKVYNPWSTLNYIADHLVNQNVCPVAYWANTSSNSIVKDLIYRADDSVKKQIEDLIAGGTITIPIHEDITYGEVYNSPENLWNFMFFTGYFRKEEEFFNDFSRERTVKLKIANYEVGYIFRDKVSSWFKEKVNETDRTVLYNAFLEGNCEIMTRELNKLLRMTISFNDYYENFYHGFLTGVLTGMNGYATKSNREGGNGRSDLFITPPSREDTAFVVELKVAKEIGGLKSRAEEAIEQIVTQKYEEELHFSGYAKTRRYGISFYHKDCLVVEG